MKRRAFLASIFAAALAPLVARAAAKLPDFEIGRWEGIRFIQTRPQQYGDCIIVTDVKGFNENHPVHKAAVDLMNIQIDELSRKLGKPVLSRESRWFVSSGKDDHLNSVNRVLGWKVMI